MNEIYRYPKGHPCYGCVHTFHISTPSCSIGNDMNNCGLRKHEKMLRKLNKKPIEFDDDSHTAIDKINRFIKVLEKVKKQKRFK